MARPNQEAIETFMSVTGCSNSVALQKLEEYNGDLSRAVDAYFSEGYMNIAQDVPAPAAQNTDIMDIDNELGVETRRPSFLSGPTLLNRFPFIDPDFSSHLFDRRDPFNGTESTGRAPFVSHPREVRQIPIEVRDGDESSARSGHGPIIVDVTDTEHLQGPEIRGRISIDDDEDEEYVSNAHTYHRPSAPNYHTDIEEEMLRAALEASRKEAEESESLRPQRRQPHVEDSELAYAISESLKTSEQDKLRGNNISVSRDSGTSVDKPMVLGMPNNMINANARGRQREAPSSSTAEDEEYEELPLVRHRSKSTLDTSTNPLNQGFVRDEAVLPVGSSDPDTTVHPQLNGNAISSDEWGGISSEEHDEALMLEAAMFGEVPQRSGYNNPYLPHQDMRSATNIAWRAPRPSSPGLTSQRSIREQQDDEYLASLQADREKELKALEEERAFKEAAVKEERRKEEATLRELEEKQELERLLAAKEASLPEEPAASEEDAVTLLVRMPDGTRQGRKFRKSDKLQSVFDFIDVGRAVKPGSYRLVRPYPRQAFSDGESMSTLKELGVMSKQEALFLEPK